jgi:hypothetical protein
MEKTLSGGRVQAGDLPALAGVEGLDCPAMVQGADGGGNSTVVGGG